MKKNNYRIRKEELRNEAMNFQCDDYDYSYGELYEIQNYFIKKGKRLGLLKEFKDEGII